MRENQPRCENSVMPAARPKAKAFDYALPYASLDLRAQPHLYTIGRGEQGVLLCEPYKSELLPHWRFRTPAIAAESSQTLYARYLAYKRAGDFVGMDMARKFLQMGVTRARRYANHRGGKKYVTAVDGTKTELPRVEVEDAEKAESARIFAGVLADVKGDAEYVRMAAAHKAMYERPAVEEASSALSDATASKPPPSKKRKRRASQR